MFFPFNPSLYEFSSQKITLFSHKADNDWMSPSFRHRYMLAKAYVTRKQQTLVAWGANMALGETVSGYRCKPYINSSDYTT